MVENIENKVVTRPWPDHVTDCGPTNKGIRFLEDASAKLLASRAQYQSEVTDGLAEVIERHQTPGTELPEIVGIGGTRVAVRLPPSFDTGRGNCLAKLPFITDKQNRVEIDTWETAPKQARGLLVPVVAHDPGNGWLMMPEGNPIDVNQRLLLRISNRLVKKLSEHGITVIDVTKDNIVELAGRYALADYGIKAP